MADRMRGGAMKDGLAGTHATPHGAVAVISSHVARGAVGNRAAVFALETLGLPVIAVPTVLLPWHPGHGAATRIVPDDAAFADFMDELAGGPFSAEIRAVLSGYLGSAAQAHAIAATVGRLRARNRNLVYVCDPVIGDARGLYVPQATAAAIRDALLPLADLATPNRFELAWLANATPSDNAGLIAAARALGPHRVLVTSAFASPGQTGNLLVDGEGALLASHQAFDHVPNGTGDLTAALFLGRWLKGERARDSLARATASVHDVLARTLARGADELTLAPEATLLAAPRTPIAVRTVAVGGR